MDLIEQEVPPDRAKFVFHWFSGSHVEAKRAVSLGCYFSVNGQMLQSDRGQALVSSLPEERLLTETDGPFTSQGSNPARPRDVGQVLKLLGTTRGLSSDESAAVVIRNLRTKFCPLRLEPGYHCRTAGGVDLVVRKRQADGAQ